MVCFPCLLQLWVSAMVSMSYKKTFIWWGVRGTPTLKTLPFSVSTWINTMNWGLNPNCSFLHTLCLNGLWHIIRRDGGGGGAVLISFSMEVLFEFFNFKTKKNPRLIARKRCHWHVTIQGVGHAYIAVCFWSLDTHMHILFPHLCPIPTQSEEANVILCIHCWPW